jgi:hypothetical protein
MAVKPIPDGYHTVTPYLTVQEAAKARMCRPTMRLQPTRHGRRATPPGR